MEMSFIISKKSFLLISMAILGLTKSENGYEKNRCYSFDELDDTLKEKLSKMSSPSNLGKYEYSSVEPKIMDNFMQCMADDVTRVQSDLEVNDEEIYNKTLNITTILEEIGAQIKQSLQAALTTDGILSKVRNVEVKFDHSKTSPTTVWTIELVVKGRASTITTDMKEEIKTKTQKTAADSSEYYALDDVGEIDATKLSFNAIMCTGNPPVAPQNGGREWNGEQYPGTKATYKCNTNYFLSDNTKAFSECTHDELKWSTPKISLTCSKGCNDQPPINPPFFTEKEGWNTDMRKEGDVATYVCMEGYRSSKVDKATSTCKNSQWTTTEIEEFNCELIECPKNIPQVPAHAQTNWDLKTVRPYTIIKYWCLDGYTQRGDGEFKVDCTVDGNWTLLSDKFECINNELAKKLGIYDKQRVVEYDYYDYARKYLSKDAPAYVNLIWITVYSFAGVILLVLVVFCVTRTDSPIFIICTGASKKTSYIPPK